MGKVGDGDGGCIVLQRLFTMTMVDHKHKVTLRVLNTATRTPPVQLVRSRRQHRRNLVELLHIRAEREYSKNEAMASIQPSSGGREGCKSAKAPKAAGAVLCSCHVSPDPSVSQASVFISFPRRVWMVLFRTQRMDITHTHIHTAAAFPALYCPLCARTMQLPHAEAMHMPAMLCACTAICSRGTLPAEMLSLAQKQPQFPTAYPPHHQPRTPRSLLPCACFALRVEFASPHTCTHCRNRPRDPPPVSFLTLSGSGHAPIGSLLQRFCSASSPFPLRRTQMPALA